MAIQVARRELLSISGISKSGNFADVEFIWRWVSINQVGVGALRQRSALPFDRWIPGL